MKKNPLARCVRFLPTPERVYCTGHFPQVDVLEYDANQNVVSGPTAVPAPEQIALEGLGLLGQTVYAAARQAGLMALAAGPPYASSGFVGGDVLEDAWDVKPLGASLLVVADGVHGLKVLDATDPVRPTLVSSLPLPGLSAFLHVEGAFAYVAAVSGGGHLVDLSDPAHPRPSSTITGEAIYEIKPIGDLIVAASGSHVIAARRGAGDALEVVGSATSHSYSMSVSPGEGGALYSAESQRAVRYEVRAGIEPGPVLIVPPRIAVGPNAVGGSLPVRLRNLGSLPLHVTNIELVDPSDRRSRVGGGFEIAPGGGRTIEVIVPDGERRLLSIESDDRGGDGAPVRLLPTRALQAGDRLPPRIQYLDEQGTPHDVIARFSGNVGLLMIAAASCPLAYYALHAAQHDLARYLDNPSVVAFSINPWDQRTMFRPDPRIAHLLSPLTTSDNHDRSEVMDLFGQDNPAAPPMPIIYVVGRDGRIVLAHWGYDRDLIEAALDAALAAP